MDFPQVGEIGRELCELWDRQMRAILHRKLSDLSDEELAAYERRRQKILQLRAELEKLARPM